MVGFGQAMLDPVRLADHIEAHWPRVDGVPVPGLFGELDAIIGKNRVDLVGHGFEHVLQELPGRLPVSSCNELSDSELGSSVDTDEKVELSLGGLNLGNVPSRGLQANRCRETDVEEAALRRCTHRLSANGWDSA
jgi:hypothetical protein